MKYRIPVSLAIPGFFLAIMPANEPHLWQKLSLLAYGWLHKPADWFDLALHGGGALLAILALAGYAIDKLRPAGK